ncbi:hypothetical protein CP97_12065 [Aurantiacibacter atlanticus]|uniref:SPOR domain-containing protein n=1 Tax=Aurantiacibacter atlanticus TaxID=1648404 RepID=A0A0H4W1M2_9SPHN|nr:tetratricopeptide repeat protein [Aurantiacibacter atlanticus]AKQ43423.2 hypothetical protein CP97_12065 [Aurantiacibacter atlanticus]
MNWSRLPVRIASAPFAAVALAALVVPFHHMPVSAQEVVQQLPNPASEDLSGALRRLSRNPDNLRALVDAGIASLELGDVDAALAFLRRAQNRDPEDGRMLAALARVAVLRGEGVAAVQLFDNADAAGASLSAVTADRALAYDLVGDNARAQRLYRQALAREADDAVTQRLALSYAISGDAAASETTLLPLLQRQDRSAYRSRAFALAILGREEEAVAIAETMLPARISGRLAPYLRYMPRLTSAQQAAAANLGRFPAASQIGQDSAEITALAQADAADAVQPVSGSAARRGASSAAASDRLTPRGPPLGRTDSLAQASTGELPPAQTPANVSPEPEARPSFSVAEPEPVQQAVAKQVVQQVASTPPPQQAAQPTLTTTAATEPASAQPAPTQASPIVQQITLAQEFADFVLPGDGLPVAASAGAVDVTTIEPARPEPVPAPPPPPPAHPSRHWVQIATGQDISAFRFDWRRIVRNAEGLLDDREAYTAPWNQTNRLVTGPFDSQSAAQDFVTQLAEKGVSAFRFTSSAGEEVREID